MTDTTKSAYDDLLNIYWRYHAKKDVPLRLKELQVHGVSLDSFAKDACLVIEGLFVEPPKFLLAQYPTPKEAIQSRSAMQNYAQLWQEQQRLVPLLAMALNELDGEDWYYLWGLHHILEMLPRTLEEI